MRNIGELVSDDEAKTKVEDEKGEDFEPIEGDFVSSATSFECTS
jgi:hypothetical protein